jgi:Uma2 family endonuclease
MSVAYPSRHPAIEYPDSDGEPMADNTLQFEWIVTIQGNLDLMFRDKPDVFVAGDHLIYPVEGEPANRQAPDVYVAFGRPKGHRGSYKVWEEEGIFPQVIFEVWSPNNRQQKMEDKRDFYERYGAEEYYIVYPDFPAHIDGWRREGGKLARIPDVNDFVSPRLGIRFELRRGSVAVYHPSGERFLNFVEKGVEAQAAQQRAEEEHRRAEEERQRAEEAARQAEVEREKAARLAARLRELGIDPDAV